MTCQRIETISAEWNLPGWGGDRRLAPAGDGAACGGGGLDAAGSGRWVLALTLMLVVSGCGVVCGAPSVG